MTLIQPVRELLEQERIECAAPLPSELCRVRDPSKLERRGFPEESIRSILILLVPYHPGKAAVPPDRNLSVYAFSRDYHLFFRELFGRIIPSLSQIFPGYRFEGFSDNSRRQRSDHQQAIRILRVSGGGVFRFASGSVVRSPNRPPTNLSALRGMQRRLSHEPERAALPRLSLGTDSEKEGSPGRDASPDPSLPDGLGLRSLSGGLSA